MPKAPWKQPAMSGATILVAGLSYYFVRLSPAEVAARNAFVSGFLITPLRPLQASDEASGANDARLAERRSRGESAEKIAKDLKRTLRSEFEMFTPDGRLNEHLMETAGIPVGKRDAIQRAFDEATEAVSSSLKSRMMPDDEKTALEKRIQAFRIPADPVEAERLLSEFRQALASACGETSAAILLEFYEPENRFGGFGRYDIALTRSPGQEVRSQTGQPDQYLETEDCYLEFITTEPGTAKEVGRISCVEDRGFEKRHFGSLLEPSPWK